MVRIGAAIAVVVLAVLLGLTIANSFGPDPVIKPTGGVTGGPQDALPGDQAARQGLADRARLQGFRAESGPSPEGARTAPATGQDLGTGDAEASGSALVNR